MTARDAVLARIRAGLVQEAPAVAVPRDYRTAGSRSADEVLALFVQRVREYRARVIVTTEPVAALEEVLAEQRALAVGVARDLPPELRPSGAIPDDALSAVALDELDGAVTTCAAACAETGTIALDGGLGQGRRALTLVPDLHVCVVRAEQIVETVPELFERLEPSARAGRPLVLVSGPSATSDIELNRVEGVHGPRRLIVIVAT